MKITFIRPNMTAQKAADALQPLVFALLKALTPLNVETAFYDDRIEEIPFDAPTDVVALTVETFAAQRAYWIAARYRKRGVPVVMGGFHPTLIPQEARQHADSVILGDAEAVWPHVIDDAQRRRLQPIYQAPPLSAPLNATFDRRIFQGKTYPPLELVQWGRGCSHSCEFCAIRAFYGKHQCQRPIECVIAEITALDTERMIFFTDDNLLANDAMFSELLTALIPLKRRWAAQISIEAAQNARMLKLLEQSGCQVILTGFESLSQANLRQMNKAWNTTVQDYESAIKRIYDHGIMIYGTFVFGYDGDTPDAFDRAVEFAIRQRLFLANFNPLTPFPGTSLYRRLQREGHLLRERWWLDTAYQYGDAMFQPANMTPEELTRGCFEARKAFNSSVSMLRRAANIAVNLRSWRRATLYAAANYINRKAIFQKQGKALGR